MQYDTPLTQRLPGLSYSFHGRKRRAQSPHRWDRAATDHIPNISIKGADGGFVSDFKLARRNLRKSPNIDLKKVTLCKQTVGKSKALEKCDPDQSPVRVKCMANAFKRYEKKTSHTAEPSKMEPSKVKAFASAFDQVRKEKPSHPARSKPFSAFHEKKVQLKNDPWKKGKRVASPSTVKKATVTSLPPIRECCEFSKRAVTLRPVPNAKNNFAATQIQKIARGWYQRLQFRVTFLEHKLATQEQGTAAEIQKIQDRLQRRKDRFLQRMKTKIKAESDRMELQARAAKEASQIIAYLRKENLKLRRKGEKLAQEIFTLKAQNERLEEISEQTRNQSKEITEHIEYLFDVHEQLLQVIPQYQASIRHLENAAGARQHNCLAEHNVKIKYFKSIGEIVEMVEERCEDEKLADEVVQYCLSL